MTPKDFIGKISVQKIESFGFLPEDEHSEKFDIWFYRRETETKSLEEFLDTIQPENVAWDNISKKLYYRDLSGKLYLLNFKEVK
jgi:hypothetical protein